MRKDEVTSKTEQKPVYSWDGAVEPHPTRFLLIVFYEVEEIGNPPSNSEVSAFAGNAVD